MITVDVINKNGEDMVVDIEEILERQNGSVYNCIKEKQQDLEDSFDNLEYSLYYFVIKDGSKDIGCILLHSRILIEEYIRYVKKMALEKYKKIILSLSDIDIDGLSNLTDRLFIRKIYTIYEKMQELAGRYLVVEKYFNNYKKDIEQFFQVNKMVLFMDMFTIYPYDNRQVTKEAIIDLMSKISNEEIDVIVFGDNIPKFEKPFYQNIVRNDFGDIHSWSRVKKIG